MKIKAVVPGTYDPITLGHIDVIMRAAKLFDEVVVGVATSENKRGSGTYFSLETRIKMVEESLTQVSVKVLPVTGLLVDFCAEQDVVVVVKGLRATTDFEYELAQADINSKLSHNLESVFIMAQPDLGYISSSAVREMANLGADISTFVPEPVVRAFSSEV